MDPVIARHELLLRTICDELDPNSDKYYKFVEHFKEYVGKGILTSRKTLLDTFGLLASMGYLGPGNYHVLKRMCISSGNIGILNLIEDAEEDIRKLYKRKKSPESSDEDLNLLSELCNEFETSVHKSQVQDKNALQAACRKFGIRSEEVEKLTGEICLDIQSGSEIIEKVWPAYRENDKTDIVFVVITKKHINSLNDINYKQDFEIVLRHKWETNDENLLVLKHELNTDSYIDDSRNREMKTVIKKYKQELRKDHSNLSMICPSSFKSIGFTDGHQRMESKDCIVLYVHIKGCIPLKEKCFPKTLDGFDVDVRENVFKMYCNGKPSDFLQNLKIGCEIGHGQKEGYGTLGGFIEHESHGLCFITCSHIFLTPDDLRVIRTPLVVCYQPSFRNGTGESNSRRCGELKFHKVGMFDEERAYLDVAFVKIDAPRHPLNGTFPSVSSEDLIRAGFYGNYTPEYMSGKVYDTDEIISHKRNRFIKYGATTLLRQGRYHSDGACVMLFGQPDLIIENQMQIIDMNLKFADEGDSGSLVFCESEEGLVAVGLLVGGCKGCAIFTPLCDILHAVGYLPPYALKTFSEAKRKGNETFVRWLET